MSRRNAAHLCPAPNRAGLRGRPWVDIVRGQAPGRPVSTVRPVVGYETTSWEHGTRRPPVRSRVITSGFPASPMNARATCGQEQGSSPLREPVASARRRDRDRGDKPSDAMCHARRYHRLPLQRVWGWTEYGLRALSPLPGWDGVSCATYGVRLASRRHLVPVLSNTNGRDPYPEKVDDAAWRRSSSARSTRRRGVQAGSEGIRVLRAGRGTAECRLIVHDQIGSALRRAVPGEFAATTCRGVRESSRTVEETSRSASTTPRRSILRKSPTRSASGDAMANLQPLAATRRPSTPADRRGSVGLTWGTPPISALWRPLPGGPRS